MGSTSAKLPADRSQEADYQKSLCELLGVVGAFLAGLFWVLDETKGNTGFFLITLFGVAGMLASGLVLGMVSDFIKTVRRGGDLKED